MARFGSLGTQYFTDDNVVLGGGSVTFYEPGTTTLKNTYSDSSMSILNTNPVLLDAAGRLPNVFFSGLAKAVLKDSDGEIIETRDPVGDFTSNVNSFSTWASDVIYDINNVVFGPDGYIYISLSANNQGNDPTLSPSDWVLFVEQIGFDGTVDNNVYVVDTSADQGIGNVSINELQSLVPITTVVASNVATVDFTGITNAFSSYVIEVLQAVPSSGAGNTNFNIITSSNNGSSFDTGAADYSWNMVSINGATVAGSEQSSDTKIWLSGAIQASAAAGSIGISTWIRLINPSDARFTAMSSNFVLDVTGGPRAAGVVYSQRNASAIVNAVRFYFETNNILTGTFTLYGVRRT